MSKTRSTPDRRPPVADLVVANLDDTRAHNVHVSVVTPDSRRVAHAERYPLAPGGRAGTEDVLPEDRFDVVVHLDGEHTEASSLRVDGGPLLVAVGNGLAHVGHGL